MKRCIICLMTLVLMTGMMCQGLTEMEEDRGRVAVNLQAIKVMLDANDLPIDFDSENDYFAVDFDLKDKRLDACTIYVCAYEDGVAIEAAYEQTAEKETWTQIILFLNRVTSLMRLGNFYLDEYDGAVVFRVFLFTDVLPPTQYSLEYNIGFALYMLDRYGKPLAALFYDGATAEEAWAMATADSD